MVKPSAKSSDEGESSYNPGKDYVSVGIPKETFQKQDLVNKCGKLLPHKLKPVDRKIRNDTNFKLRGGCQIGSVELPKRDVTAIVWTKVPTTAEEEKPKYCYDEHHIMNVTTEDSDDHLTVTGVFNNLNNSLYHGAHRCLLVLIPKMRYSTKPNEPVA